MTKGRANLYPAPPAGARLKSRYRRHPLADQQSDARDERQRVYQRPESQDAEDWRRVSCHEQGEIA